MTCDPAHFARTSLWISHGIDAQKALSIGGVDSGHPFHYITAPNLAGSGACDGGTEMDTDIRQELQRHLLDYALRFGDFTLTSGRQSDYYIDGRQTTLHARGVFLAAQLLLEELKRIAVDAIGGPTLGADPMIGAVLALAALENLPLVGFIVRKEPKRHGTQQLIEGPLQPGMRVAVCDDTVTTGGSLKHAIEQVEAAQCSVVKVFAIVDRLEGAQQSFAQWGYPFQALFTIDELRTARQV
jgi:orotate phosphoribosyltransferase